MNIKTAKEQIANAMKAYFSKDESGEYIIPIERQRPVFLMGPPGIGKTAIMEQVAAEMGVGILSYSMTHHTRQSALGLPFIEHKTYGGKEYSVSEYTMSEIIASVYDLMEETGVKEGILFLDEMEALKASKAVLDKYVAGMKAQIGTASSSMTNAMSFCDECFSKGQEVLILITEFTSNTNISKFIGKYGLEEYYKHNRELLFYERNQELMKEISELDEE